MAVMEIVSVLGDQAYTPADGRGLFYALHLLSVRMESVLVRMDPLQIALAKRRAFTGAAKRLNAAVRASPGNAPVLQGEIGLAQPFRKPVKNLTKVLRKSEEIE